VVGRAAARAGRAAQRRPGNAVLSPDHHDVIVIGAGLAGLRCAIDLVAAGREVTVLEARSRVGGRVHSHRFADGQWAERGAEFVDTAHTEVIALARSLGLSMSDVPSGRDDDARLLDVSGRPAPFSMHHSLAGDLARWHEALGALAAQVDPYDLIGAASADRLDELPLSALLESAALGLMARVVVGRDVRTEYMVSPDQVSQLMAGWMTALHRSSGDGFEGHRIAGGNDQLATGLASQLGDRVQLSTPVAWIDASDGAVTLRSGELLTADHVVAAVPLPVLARLWAEIPPALSSAGYGVGGKVSVQFARRLWRDQGRDGSVRTERSWGEVWETTDGQHGDAGVLTALLSSNDGAAMVALPEAVDRVIDEVDRIFPGLKGLAGERVQTDWTNDQYSLGAYVTFGPRQLVAAWPLMHRRYGSLLLAGEHTDPWAGYMEGALRSGARVARTITAP
jgi:monoamine oxidase